MREQYIKQVKKELSASRKQKKEILRDLNEAFDSAVEHGETEEQIISRLGAPKNFAENVEEKYGFNWGEYRKKRKKLMQISCLCGIAIVCFTVALIVRNSMLPSDVIGQADAMTSITVKGIFPFDISVVLLIIGFAFTVFAVIQVIGFVCKRKDNAEGK